MVISDVPLVAQGENQGNHRSQPKEVHQVLVTVGELQSCVGLFLMNWASKSGHLVTLVAYVMSTLSTLFWAYL